MKIIGHLSEDLMKQTENRYDNIWISFSLILSLCGLFLILHYMLVEQMAINIFMIIFSVCIIYFTVISFLKLFKSDYEDKKLRIFDVIGVIVGSVAAYSLCAAVCLITSTI